MTITKKIKKKCSDENKSTLITLSIILKIFLNKKDEVKLVKASVPVTGPKTQLSPDVFPI